MRLATRALIAALATLVLCTAVSAQTPRGANDPRNQAPTVGTGGGPGGPTGLFTIYDGDTLRRGEFTFSIAYSNYDRDPGDVDITEIPTSFNIGINDHLELFFNIDAYRGVKVNNPKHLSSFYLPNSQLSFGQRSARKWSCDYPGSEPSDWNYGHYWSSISPGILPGMYTCYHFDWPNGQLANYILYRRPAIRSVPVCRWGWTEFRSYR